MGAFVPLKNVGEHDANLVGQKAILLGQKSVSVPFSLVITSNVFVEFIKHNNLMEEINALFSNEEGSTENLVRGFNELAPKILESKFPSSISQGLRECFELACLDTKSLDVLQGKKTQHSLLSLRRSVTYNDQDIVSKGVTYTKDTFDGFLHALKTVYLSAFAPSSVVLRQQMEVTDFSIAVVVSRLPNIKTCFESSYLVDQKKLFVSSYIGFIDKSKTVQRDTFEVAVDFLKVTNQKINRQTAVSLFDLQLNKPAIKTFDAGTSQSATEQNILEIARLTKKIAGEFHVKSLLGDFVMDSDKKMYCLDVWTSQIVEARPHEQEEPLELSQEPTNNLHKAIISFLKEHRDSSYGDAINIILRSLETDSSSQTIVQGILMCKEILEHQ
ncbi:MAG: hypothetical protein KC535_00340 [Nanoarchaeota archaeon]|nr:hypothetical protein [Nanoarchaeota archaeon]